jgi:hypothetical protein
MVHTYTPRNAHSFLVNPTDKHLMKWFYSRIRTAGCSIRLFKASARSDDIKQCTHGNLDCRWPYRWLIPNLRLSTLSAKYSIVFLIISFFFSGRSTNNSRFFLPRGLVKPEEKRCAAVWRSAFCVPKQKSERLNDCSYLFFYLNGDFVKNFDRWKS